MLSSHDIPVDSNPLSITSRISVNPSNIVHLNRLIEPVCRNGFEQRKFYDPGVGTYSGRLRNFMGSMFGIGLNTNILEMYSFLSDNYTEGDHIYLFGYSRGAYTVRSLAGLIYRLGLPRKCDKQILKKAFELYRAELGPESPEAVEFRRQYGERVSLKLVACFDTVGALGVSDRSPWPLSLLSKPERYKFHDVQLNNGVEHAIHALSIDEDFYIPELMTACPERGSEQLTQVYLPGYHGGVGGGSAEEQGLADNALRFVVEEMERRGIELELAMDDVPNGDAVGVELREPVGLFSLENVAKLVSGVYIRRIEAVDEVHESAVRRYVEKPEWRPRALRGLEEEILKRWTSMRGAFS